MLTKKQTRKRILSRFIYWLTNRVEIYIDYTSDIPLDSLTGKALTKTWESLLEASLWLRRRGY